MHPNPSVPILNLLPLIMRPVVLAVLAGVVSSAVSLTMPNYYRSEARLLPVETKATGGTFGGLANAAAAFGVGVPGGDGNDANFVDVLNSRWMREQLVNTEFQFHTRSWRFGEEKAVRKSLYVYLDAKNMDHALQGMGGLLSASRDLKSKIISISAETTSPELSQAVVQKAVKLLELFNREKGRTRGGAKAAFAEARLCDARQELDEAEDAFRRFIEAKRNYLTSGDPDVHRKGARLETELRLRQQLVASIAMNREQALLDEKNDIPILNVLDPGSLPINKSRPERSKIILVTTMLTGVVSWLWLHREWVKAKLLTPELPIISSKGTE